MRSLLACAAVIAAASAARADVAPLTLYERVGRAPLIVWGEVEDGEHRFALIRTLEVIRCGIPERPGSTLQIAFRLDSFLRRPWQDKIEFLDGERVVLYLRKFTKEDGRQPEGEIYTLMWGAQGKQLLRLEGEAAQVDAVRRFATIASSPVADQPGLMRTALSDANPIIADTAFEEMIRQGLGDLDMIPQLTGFLTSEREPPRALSLRLIAQIVDDARVAGREVPRREELSDLVRGRAAVDTSVPFRVQAIATLAVLGGESNRSYLQRAARDDPSQLVRYEADKHLLSWRQEP